MVDPQKEALEQLEEEKKIREKAQTKQKPSPLTEFQRIAEAKKKYEKIYPEPDLIPFKPTERVELKIDIKEKNEKGETQVTQIVQPQAEKTVYRIQKNPNLLCLMNIANSKIYFDMKTYEFYQYVFQPDRKRILRKMRLENHDILNLGIFFLWVVMRDRPLHVRSKLYLNRKIRKKIAELRKKEADFYGNESEI